MFCIPVKVQKSTFKRTTPATDKVLILFSDSVRVTKNFSRIFFSLMCICKACLSVTLFWGQEWSKRVFDRCRELQSVSCLSHYVSPWVEAAIHKKQCYKYTERNQTRQWQTNAASAVALHQCISEEKSLLLTAVTAKDNLQLGTAGRGRDNGLFSNGSGEGERLAELLSAL